MPFNHYCSTEDNLNTLLTSCSPPLTGQHGHLLLSFTIKHIDHKVIAKEPAKQISIVKVASNLARHAKLKASVTIASAISDLIKHLRKCMHFAIEASTHADDGKWNSALHVALEDCLVQLTEKVIMLFWFLITNYPLFSS